VLPKVISDSIHQQSRGVALLTPTKALTSGGAGMRCAVNMGKLRNEAVKMRWVELTWWLIYRPVCSR